MQESLLKHFPWRWALHWLIVPNLAVVMMWPIGGPPMGEPLLAGGCLALVFSQMPWTWAKRIAAMGLTLFTIGFYIARNFSVNVADPLLAGTVLTEANPLRSSYYLVGAFLVIASIYLVFHHAPRVPRFGITMNWLLGFLAIIGVIRFDEFATAATRGSYGGAPMGSIPFASAVGRAGYATPPSDRRNVVIIVVEALGNPVSPAARAQFDADWNRPEWRARYDVTSGAVPYFGATVNAEMRELCGVWSFAQSFDYARANCLPARYARAGYQTTAMHAFTGDMYDRIHWWPQAGFQTRLFRDDLVQRGARACGGVFPGACDEDLPAQIAHRLKQANRPQLIYWMTLNSHVPVVEDVSLGTENCNFGGEGLASESPLLCPLFLVHHHLADAISKLAMDPNLPPTDFVIVGDHMPPLFERSARVRFDGFHVPWVMLHSRIVPVRQPTT